MTPLRAGIGGVDVAVDDSVERHRKPTSANRRQQYPEEVNIAPCAKLANSDQVPHENEGEREQRVFDFDEGQDLLDVHHSGPPKERWSGHSYLLSSGWEATFTNTYTRLRHRERLLRYLPEKLVSAVETGAVDIEPGGERRNVTILMADIRSFTGLCEHNDPEVVTGMLNRYFSAMSVPIFKHDGMIDKFIGDAIMAVFGAPQEKSNNADNAILAAQEMLAQLAVLNSEFAKEGLPQLEIGIGIHSGEAIAGNVGSISCMDYTVIGDTVNVAARIESQTKALGYKLLISQSTAEQSQLDSLNKVANVRLKGRDKTIDLYSLSSS